MGKVKKALGTLQFVEKDKPISADVKTHQVVFTVTDKAQFDLAKVQDCAKYLK